MTEPSSSKVWLVTGCSSGFGQLFVPAIVARGDKVIATARNISSLLVHNDDENVRVLQLDVTASQEDLKSKIQEARSLFGRIDVLVNNAGYLAPGVWEQVTHEQTLDQFATNFFGPMMLTRAILPHFRDQRSGTVVFMSSIAAWHGVAAGGLYSSSKFALEGAVECLEQELAPFNVRTHLIVLGQFRTSILDPSKSQARVSEGVAEYDQIMEKLQTRYANTHGRQRGSPNLGVEKIVDLVKRQGPFQGRKKLPLRLVLGSDAVDVVRAKCRDVLAEVSEFETLSRSTDCEDTEFVPSYTR